jgi:hypothetical protein
VPRDALVVGGSIHARLTRRQELVRRGYRVTVETSLLRGLAQLRRFPFTVCEVDLGELAYPRRWHREYAQACRARGVLLRELPGAAVQEEAPRARV